MANLETQTLDAIIANRRSLLKTAGGAALAAMVMPSTIAKAAVNLPSDLNDFDILNFALNLEYLEANFYYMAAFGTTIDNVSGNATASAAGVGSNLSIASGTGTAGVRATTTGATAVPFVNPVVKAYAIETAIEEGRHVAFLQKAIGSTSVAQPAIDISVSVFTTLANLAGVGAPFVVGGVFNPYLNDTNFLAGAFIFEDVGVTAYRGAAPLISTSSSGKSILQAAASILAVEAYHAGLIRSTIYAADPANAAMVLTGTQKIAQLRANAAHATGAVPTTIPAFPAAGASFPDDFGLYPATYPQAGTSVTPTSANVTLGAKGASVSASNVADADPTYVIAFGRTTNQVLNIVTANQNNAGPTQGTAAKGGFFPNGVNGRIA